jgi:hypothetical protein
MGRYHAASVPSCRSGESNAVLLAARHTIERKKLLPPAKSRFIEDKDNLATLTSRLAVHGPLFPQLRT